MHNINEDLRIRTCDADGGMATIDDKNSSISPILCAKQWLPNSVRKSRRVVKGKFCKRPEFDVEYKHNSYSRAQWCTRLEILSDDAIAQFYVTKFSTISLHLTKLYAIQSFAKQRHQSNSTAKSAKTFLTVWSWGYSGQHMGRIRRYSRIKDTSVMRQSCTKYPSSKYPGTYTVGKFK